MESGFQGQNLQVICTLALNPCTLPVQGYPGRLYPPCCAFGAQQGTYADIILNGIITHHTTKTNICFRAIDKEFICFEEVEGAD